MAWIADSKLPNRLKVKRVIPFRNELDSETFAYLESLKKLGKRNEFINRAIFFLYKYEVYRKAFLVDIIQNNYELCRSLLRKIGSTLVSQEGNNSKT